MVNGRKKREKEGKGKVKDENKLKGHYRVSSGIPFMLVYRYIDKKKRIYRYTYSKIARNTDIPEKNCIPFIPVLTVHNIVNPRGRMSG